MKRLFKEIAAIILSLVAAALVMVLVMVVIFRPKDSVLDSLPRYDKKEFYSSGGLQDFTDYAKYTYRITESELVECESLRPVTEEDIPDILEYVEFFENVIEDSQDFPSESYDFDKSQISTGDCFFIYNRYEEPEKAFWFFKLYYFDLDTGTLYYFRFNI